MISVESQELRFWIRTHGDDCQTKGINKKIFRLLSSAQRGYSQCIMKSVHSFRILFRSSCGISGDRKGDS